MTQSHNNVLELANQVSAFTQLFEAQVAKTPEAVAVSFEGENTTYDELNRRANQLAGYLLERGFERESRVGICLDRSTNAIICMLGILKSGCAFVPLDPEFPSERLAYIVDHANIRLIFCEADYRQLYANLDASEVELIDPESPEIWDRDSDNLDIDHPGDSLAYVMYTSGSTGKPKGVQIEHRSLTTYCLADIEVYQLQAADRTLQFSTLNFDVAIEEIYPPLLVGSTVVVRPRQRAEQANELSHLIDSNSITALHIATAYWNEWVDLMAASKAKVPASLRLVIVTGEKISVEHYRRWQGLCNQPILWCNAYGPTETTVTCTVFIPPDDWQGTQMPIGQPLPGYTAHILNDALQPVKSGETGHLFIGGDALARGYLSRPDLTEKAFQYVQFDGDDQPLRLYRTGDLARWLPSGDIEFSGRVDHQMKIGSYRIEPGEIEAVIHQDARVRESLVVCDEVDGQKYLVAYVVPHDERLDPTALAAFLRTRLPAYMVPARYVFIEQMPKTINGKIDRAALPAASEAVLARDCDWQAAERPLEVELAAIWSKVLNIPTPGIHDDFFMLGGSSLLVTRVIAHMSDKLKSTIPVRDFFANPTIAALAHHLELQSSHGLDSETAIEHAARQQRLTVELRRRLPRIQPLAIDSQGYRLAAIHYPPVSIAKENKRHVVIIVPSYGHEYARAHRNLQQLAVQLAQAGFDAIRFDLAGTGDSDGGVDRLSIAQWKQDVSAVAAAARRELDLQHVSIVGVRLGATLAAHVDLHDIQHFFAWDPIGFGDRYLKLLRSFHHRELNGLCNYLVRRRSSQYELMGYAWPEKLQTEVSQLVLPQQPHLQCAHYWQLITQELHPNVIGPANAASGTDRTVHNLKDEIFWNEQTFTNKAFSSPDACRVILESLQGAD